MFCPGCRHHWAMDEGKGRGAKQLPMVCPDCAIPLAFDRTEAEFPVADLYARSAFPALTIRQILKETSGDSVTYSNPCGHTLEDEYAPDTGRRLRDKLMGWRRTFTEHRDQAIAFTGLITMLIAGSIGFWITRAAIVDTKSALGSSLPKSIAPLAFPDGFQRWPDITQGTDSSDGHGFATATYQKGSSTAELWIEWIGDSSSPGDQAWRRFSQENPVEYTPTGQQPLQDKTGAIDGVRCRILALPPNPSASARLIPTAWLPTAQPYTIAWDNDGHVMIAAGSQPAATELARDIIAWEKASSQPASKGRHT